MLSVMKGIIYPRFFIGSAWEGRNVKPLKRLLKIPYRLGRYEGEKGGKIERYWRYIYLYLVQRPKRDIYNNKILTKKAEAYLQKYFNLKFENVSEMNPLSGFWTARSKQDGSYVGTAEDALVYHKRFGIEHFYKAADDDNVTSIGFNPKNNKWYGWSHRAIYGFGIGYVVKEGNCETESGFIPEYEASHPEEVKSMPVGFKCETLEDCKRCAIVFATSVS